MAPSSILVLGAGQLGDPVLRSLAMHPDRGDCKIALLRRNAAVDNRYYDDLGISVVIGDIAVLSKAQLTEVFRGYHTVIGCTGMTLPTDAHMKIAQAAQQGGVKRFFPWQFGGDYDTIGRGTAQYLFDVQLDVRDWLRSQSKMQWVVVSVGVFMPFIFFPGLGIVNEDRTKVTALGSWENRVTGTAVEDIGRIVAEIALANADIEGVVFAAGDTVSCREIADTVETVTGRKIERKLLTTDDIRAAISANPDNVFMRYQLIFAEQKGIAWDVASTFNAQKSMQMTSILQWARKNLVLPK